jgi:hypothetical protein
VVYFKLFQVNLVVDKQNKSKKESKQRNRAVHQFQGCLTWCGYFWSMLLPEVSEPPWRRVLTMWAAFSLASSIVSFADIFNFEVVGVSSVCVAESFKQYTVFRARRDFDLEKGGTHYAFRSLESIQFGLWGGDRWQPRAAHNLQWCECKICEKRIQNNYHITRSVVVMIEQV